MNCLLLKIVNAVADIAIVNNKEDQNHMAPRLRTGGQMFVLAFLGVDFVV